VDKLAFVLTPAWLYLPLARASGELWEYIERSKDRQRDSEYFTPTKWSQVNSQNPREWFVGRQSCTHDWVLKYCFADEPDLKPPDRERTGSVGRRPHEPTKLVPKNPSARRTTLIGLATRPRKSCGTALIPSSSGRNWSAWEHLILSYSAPQF
jgi:hypothetical protein